MRDHKHNPDPNLNAARIVAATTAAQQTPPNTLDEAWQEWSSHIQNVDERA